MSPTQTPLEQLLRLFALETVAPDHFIGQSLDLGFRNLFGGHILGQSLVAAGNTCEERSAHSLHAYFIRGGDPLVPIHYKVERVRDGGTFSVRRVVASQSDKPILILSSSFQAEEEGFEHQATMPDVPEPESLAPAAKSQPPDSEPTGAQTGGSNMPDLAIEIRPISPIDRYHPDKREPSQHIWFRAAGPVVGNPHTSPGTRDWPSPRG
jgi:acyl-CoA thioesterase-2